MKLIVWGFYLSVIIEPQNLGVYYRDYYLSSDDDPSFLKFMTLRRAGSTYHWAKFHQADILY